MQKKIVFFKKGDRRIGSPFYRYTEEDLPFVSYYTIYMAYRQYFMTLFLP